MPHIKILTKSNLRKLAPLDDEAGLCVENAFRALVTKAVAMPPTST